jgi:hypothetical protein
MAMKCTRVPVLQEGEAQEVDGEASKEEATQEKVHLIECAQVVAS